MCFIPYLNSLIFCYLLGHSLLVMHCLLYCCQIIRIIFSGKQYIHFKECRVPETVLGNALKPSYIKNMTQHISVSHYRWLSIILSSQQASLNFYHYFIVVISGNGIASGISDTHYMAHSYVMCVIFPWSSALSSVLVDVWGISRSAAKSSNFLTNAWTRWGDLMVSTDEGQHLFHFFHLYPTYS